MTNTINTSPLIQTTDLSYRYARVQALDGVNLSLSAGHIVGLLGQNGCGKTTLFKCLAGMLDSYEGEIQIAGASPGPASKARVAFLPDESPLPRSETVAYLLGYYQDFFTDFDVDKARRLIASFGLQESMSLTQMSKGMREKVQVALTMGRQAQVYLLDEPISGVDPAARDSILDGIVADLRPDSLVVISTHLIHDLEPVLDYVVLMRDGTVLLEGDVDDLRSAKSASIDQIFRETYAC